MGIKLKNSVTVFILIFVSLLVSCSDSVESNPEHAEEFIINGRVIDKLTNKPVENVEVLLMAHPDEDDEEQLLKFIDTCYTTNNGTFNFTCNTLDNLFLKMFSMDYFVVRELETFKYNDYQEVELSATNYQDIECSLTPFAWFTIDYQPITELQDGEYISIEVDGAGFVFTKQNPHNDYSFFITYATEPVHLSWNVKRNNNELKYYSKEITLTPFEETILVVEY